VKRLTPETITRWIFIGVIALSRALAFALAANPVQPS
jgi:hypothetical protein